MIVYSRLEGTYLEEEVRTCDANPTIRWSSVKSLQPELRGSRFWLVLSESFPMAEVINAMEGESSCIG